MTPYDLVRLLRQKRLRLSSVAAPVFAVGIIVVLVLTAARPSTRLARALERLPVSVVAVRLGVLREDDGILSAALGRRFPVRVDDLPVGVEPRALLYVEDGPEVSPVALYFRQDVPHGGRAGILWEGAILSGAAGAVQRITTSPPAAASELAALRPFLAARASHVLLIRQAFLARQHPLLVDLSGLSWDAVAWTERPSHLDVRAYHQGAVPSLGTARQLFPTSLPPPLFAADGLPAHLVFPAPLPPLLDALREASGVGVELKRLQEFFGSRPVALGVFDQGGAIAPVLVAAVDAQEEDTLVALLADLFAVRLRDLHAVPERVLGQRGVIIRHRQPARGTTFVVTDVRGGARFLRAPCGLLQDLRRAPDSAACAQGAAETTVPHDLVAMIGRGRVVVGFSVPAVTDVFRAVALPEGSPDSPGAALTVDLERLRHLPIVETVLQNLPPGARATMARLASITGFLTPVRGGLDVTMTITRTPEAASLTPGPP